MTGDMVGLRNFRAASIIRAAAILAGATLLMWVTIGVTLTSTIGRRSPEIALRWWPWGAAPKAALATGIATRQNATAADLARAEQLAREAVAREPVNVEAVRTLAMLYARRNDLAGADRLFAFSERLSRRDTTTQLWLIEKAVRENDIPRALKHYDRAMRTSRSTPDLLLPTLIAAADDPEITPPLARILSLRPNWWRQFMLLAVKDIKNAHTLVTFGRSVKLDIGVPADTALARAIVDRLIQDQAFTEANAYYAELTKTPAHSPAGIRDGGFDLASTGLPFDWQLQDEPNLSATKEVFGDKDTRLVLRANGGRGGEVARQLLILGPGAYEISGRAGETGRERLAQPKLILRCKDGPVVLNQSLPQADDAGVTFRAAFNVPATGCGAQWIGVQTAAAVETEAWIDGLAIRRQ